jgi:hypothetical protein
MVLPINERRIRHGPSGKPATEFFELEANLAAGTSDTLFSYTLPQNSSVDVSIKLEAKAGAKRTSWRWFGVYENQNGLAVEQTDFRVETLDEDDASWAPTITLSGAQLLITINADAAAPTGVRARVFLLEETWTSEPLVLIGPLPTLLNLDTNTISGKGTPGETVVVTVGGLAFGSAVVDANGDWSVSALLILPAVGTTTVVATMGALSDTRTATVEWAVDTTGLIAWVDERVGVDVVTASASVPADLTGWTPGPDASIDDANTVTSTANGVSLNRFIQIAPGTVKGPASITIHFASGIDPAITHIFVQTELGSVRAWLNLSTGVVSDELGGMTGSAVSDGAGGWIATFDWTVATTNSIIYIVASSGAGSTSSNCAIGAVTHKILDVSVRQFNRATDWASQEPVGPVFSQGTVDAQPTYIPPVTLDGIDDRLDAGATLDETLLNGPGTIIFRVNRTDANSGTLFTTSNGGFNTTFLTGIYFGSSAPTERLFFGFTNQSGTAIYALLNNGPWVGDSIVGARWDGSTAEVHLRGVTPTSSAITSFFPAGVHSGNPMFGDPTTGFGGGIYAALIFNRKLTPAEYAQVEEYLFNQWPF